MWIIKDLLMECNRVSKVVGGLNGKGVRREGMTFGSKDFMELMLNMQCE